MSNTSYLIGMDLGTTNIKAILLREDGTVIASASRANQLIFPGANQVEQDANLWWSNAVEILREITSAAGPEIVSAIQGICVSSQTVTMLPVDEAGTPLRNGLIWMDSRSAQELQFIEDTLGFDHFVRIIGAQPDVAFLPNKILWFKKNEPELFARTKSILQASSFINMKLTGQFTMDIDQAARCQCLDITAMDWSPEISQVIGVDLNALLPKPVAVNEIIGTVTAQAAAETGLIEGIPVAAGASDAMASMYATGLCRLGEAGESSGTTSLVFVGSNGKSAPDVPVVTKPCAIEGMPYIFDAPINTSGAAIKWYLDTFGEADRKLADEKGINVYELLNQEALEVPAGSNGVMFFPYLLGERAPLWNSYARGMFIGMSLDTTREEMVRAVFEGTAFALRHVMETVKEAGAVANCLRITGGGSKSRTWSMIKASMLRMPIYILDEGSGDVPFGDTLIVGNAVGVFPDLNSTIDKLVKVKEVVEPNEAWAAAYDKLYPFYLKMYQHLDEDLRAFKDVVTRL